VYKSPAEITRACLELETLLSLHTERFSIPPSGINIALKHSAQLSRYLIKRHTKTYGVGELYIHVFLNLKVD